MRFLALVAITLTLVGCVPAEPAVTPVPVPSSTPLFASDADALAAATAAYAAYLAMSDQITAEGGANPERIAPYVTSAQLSREVAAFSSFLTKKEATEGRTRFDSVALEDFRDQQVSIYLCVDFTGIQLVGTNGIEGSSAPEPVRTPLEVSMVRSSSYSIPLLIERSEVWSGRNYCLQPE